MRSLYRIQRERSGTCLRRLYQREAGVYGGVCGLQVGKNLLKQQIKIEKNYYTFGSGNRNAVYRERVYVEKKFFNKNKKTLLIVIVVIAFIGMIAKESVGSCAISGCNNKQAEGSRYCYFHRMYNRKSSSYGNSSDNNNHSSSNTSFNSSSTKNSDEGNVRNYNSNYNNSGDYSNRSKTDLSNRSSYSTTAWKDKNTYNSYDDGYDDIYMNEEYDSDRYDRDSDYADGVDDAMDEFDEDY